MAGKRLLDILLSGAKGYAAGAKSDIPELGIASGFTTGAESMEQSTKKNRRDELVKQAIALPPEKRSEFLRNAFLESSPEEALKAEAEGQIKNERSRKRAIGIVNGKVLNQDDQGNLSLDEIPTGQLGSGKPAEPGKPVINPLVEKPEPKPAPDRSMQREISKAKTELAKTRPLVTSAIGEISRVEKLNENSFSGMVGAVTMKAAQATNIGSNSPKFKNTSDVINTMQSQVSKVLKSTFGGQLSDAEREYLNSVYGALPGMTISERSIAMKNVKKMLQDKLSGAESTLQELTSDSGLAAPAGGSDVIFATNPKTGQKIQSSDGGKTWQPEQ